MLQGDSLWGGGEVEVGEDAEQEAEQLWHVGLADVAGQPVQRSVSGVRVDLRRGALGEDR